MSSLTLTKQSSCQWFALCSNTATDTQTHPILGEVPICERCKAKVTAIDSKTQNRK